MRGDEEVHRHSPHLASIGGKKLTLLNPLGAGRAFDDLNIGFVEEDGLDGGADSGGDDAVPELTHPVLHALDDGVAADIANGVVAVVVVIIAVLVLLDVAHDGDDDDEDEEKVSMWMKRRRLICCLCESNLGIESGIAQAQNIPNEWEAVTAIINAVTAGIQDCGGTCQQCLPKALASKMPKILHVAGAGSKASSRDAWPARLRQIGFARTESDSEQSRDSHVHEILL